MVGLREVPSLPALAPESSLVEGSGPIGCTTSRCCTLQTFRGFWVLSVPFWDYLRGF